MVVIKTLVTLLSPHPAMGATLEEFSNGAHSALLNGHHVLATDEYISGFSRLLQQFIPPEHRARLGV